MKLIFLHGLGQDASAWNQVKKELNSPDSQTLELFKQGQLSSSFSSMRAALANQLAEQEEDFILVGLSLGAMLALDVSREAYPHLKGLLLSGAHYKLKQSWAYRLQLLIFKILPKWFFKKQGWTKASLVNFYASLADFDLTASLGKIAIPVRLLCGQKDRANQAASQDLSKLLPQASLITIEGSGHQLNREVPDVFARAIGDFVAEIEKTS